MKLTNKKGIVAKTLMVALAAGTIAFAGTQKAEAQWAVGVQVGQPAYTSGYYPVYDRGYYRDHEAREAYERQQAYLAHERWEHERREAYARQQAYYAHERHEQREHANRYHDRDDYR
jgi:hypothetical protein